MKDLKNVTFETNTTQFLHTDFKEYPNRQDRFTVTWSCSKNFKVSGELGRLLLSPEVANDYASVDNSDVYPKFVVSDRIHIDEAGRVVSEYSRAGLECPCIPCPWVAGQKSTILMYKKLRILAWKEVGGSFHDYISRSLVQCLGNLNCLKKFKYKLIQLDNIDVKKDPVRPELDVKFRTSDGRKIYGLRDPEGDICAIMCFAFTDDVPKTVEEMDDYE